MDLGEVFTRLVDVGDWTNPIENTLSGTNSELIHPWKNGLGTQKEMDYLPSIDFQEHSLSVTGRVLFEEFL